MRQPRYGVFPKVDVFTLSAVTSAKYMPSPLMATGWLPEVSTLVSVFGTPTQGKLQYQYGLIYCTNIEAGKLLPYSKVILL